MLLSNSILSNRDLVKPKASNENELIKVFSLTNEQEEEAKELLEQNPDVMREQNLTGINIRSGQDFRIKSLIFNGNKGKAICHPLLPADT